MFCPSRGPKKKRYQLGLIRYIEVIVIADSSFSVIEPFPEPSSESYRFGSERIQNGRKKRFLGFLNKEKIFARNKPTRKFAYLILLERLFFGFCLELVPFNSQFLEGFLNIPQDYIT